MVTIGNHGHELEDGKRFGLESHSRLSIEYSFVQEQKEEGGEEK
jgi:hypothetical protein